MSDEAWFGLNRILEEQEHKVPRAPEVIQRHRAQLLPDVPNIVFLWNSLCVLI